MHNADPQHACGIQRSQEHARIQRCKEALPSFRAVSDLLATKLSTNVFKAFGAATDLVYALFPIVVIWPLRMPRKRKIQLASIMCLGTLYVTRRVILYTIELLIPFSSAAAGAVKTFYLQQLRSRADFTCQSSFVCLIRTHSDLTWVTDDATSLMVWYTFVLHRTVMHSLISCFLTSAPQH